MNSATVSTQDSSFHKRRTSISVSGRSDVYHYPSKLTTNGKKETNQKAICFGKSPAYIYSTGAEQVAPGNVGEGGEASALQ